MKNTICNKVFDDMAAKEYNYILITIACGLAIPNCLGGAAEVCIFV
jgi:hypothetical protein